MLTGDLETKYWKTVCMAYANCFNQLNWYVGIYVFEVTRKQQYAHWDIILRFLNQNTISKYLPNYNCSE